MFLITFFFSLKFLIPFNSSLSSPSFISTHTSYYAFYFNIFFLSYLSLLSHQLSHWLSFLDFSNPKKTRERVNGVVEIIIKNNYLKKINCLRVHWWILRKKEKGKGKKFIMMFDWEDWWKENWCGPSAFSWGPPKYFLSKLGKKTKEGNQVKEMDQKTYVLDHKDFSSPTVVFLVVFFQQNREFWFF